MKKNCDELNSENQVVKEKMSLGKEESHPSSKRLNDLINSLDLINSGRKSLDKRSLDFIDETTTPSSSKQSLLSLVKKRSLRKLILKRNFSTLIALKWDTQLIYIM